MLFAPFGGRFFLKATWNNGKVECWNTGYERWKIPFYSNDVESTFFDDVRFDSVFPDIHLSSIPEPKIPLFHHSPPADERSELRSVDHSSLSIYLLKSNHVCTGYVKTDDK